MSKDHYLPRLIIRNFADNSGKIYFFNKKDKKIYGPFDHYNQLQEKNFYSKKSLKELKRIFSHIKINPIFQDPNLSLDKNMELYLERPMSNLLSKIIEQLLDDKPTIISQVEAKLIKEYFIIQHLRTPMHKRVSNEFHKKTLKLPYNVREIIMQGEHEREINPKDFVNKYFANLNHEQRRVKLKLFNKKLKKNPDFIEDIRNSKKTEEILEAEVKRSEKELERIKTHPDKHSSEILDLKLRDIFSKREDVDLDSRKIKFLINNTLTPFVLSDTGIKIICWDYGFKKELHLYLPIHPKILIEFSQDPREIELIDETFVREFNQISKEESLINIYSSSKGTLKLLK